MFFGCTNLRIGASRAKFDEKSDSDLHFAVAPQKRRENLKKHNFRGKLIVHFFTETKNYVFENRLQRILAKFCAAYVWGVNDSSKFR